MSMHEHRSPAGDGAAAGDSDPRAGGINWPRLYDLILLALTRGREQAYRDDLLTLCGIASGQSVLDVGCGTGTQAIAAHRRVQPHGSVVGIDVSPRMVAAARRKARRAGLDIQFDCADATALPFPAGRSMW